METINQRRKRNGFDKVPNDISNKKKIIEFKEMKYVIKALLHRIFGDWRIDLFPCVIGFHRDVVEVKKRQGKHHWKFGHFICERCGRKILKLGIQFEENKR